MKKWVVIEQSGDNGIRDGIFCTGIFNDVETAIGHAMNSIWDFQDSYKGEGDSFEISSPQDTEGDGGFAIFAKYKAASWEHECVSYWYILDISDEEKENEK